MLGLEDYLWEVRANRMPVSVQGSLLKESFFFDSLSPEELQALAALTCHRQYDSGALIFSEGEAATAFFLVLSGRIQAYKIGPDGKELILHLVGPGEVFAEYPVFGGIEKYPAYAQCLESSEVLAIPAEAFKAMVSNKPEILMKMLARFSQRLKEFNGLIEDLSLLNVDSRLAKYLLTLTDEAKLDAEATITIHKKTLAAILGTIPETLSRTLKRLKEQGMITVDQKNIRIVNRDALKQLANVE